jgi:hypothetical protein
MAKNTLAALPLSSNDIYTLAQIFHSTFQYYCTVFDPSEKDYLREISTLVGLGFAAILTDGDLLCFHEPRLQTFMRFYQKFKEHPEYLQMFSRAIAEIVSGAAFVFRFVKYPAYHEEFTRLLRKALNHFHVGAGGTECNRLFDLLSQKISTGLF